MVGYLRGCLVELLVEGLLIGWLLGWSSGWMSECLAVCTTERKVKLFEHECLKVGEKQGVLIDG